MKKILIVDDEPDVVNYLDVVLKSNGYESYSAGDIKTAMRLVEGIHPDLICLDIVMPNETGISFYIKLQQDKDLEKIPVIIMSGIVESDKFDFSSFVSDTSISPPECYMEKPLDIEKFIHNIEQLTH